MFPLVGRQMGREGKTESLMVEKKKAKSIVVRKRSEEESNGGRF